MAKLVVRLMTTGLLLISSLAICEAVARSVFPVPDVLNFNRIDFTPPGVFGGFDELAKEGAGGIDSSGFSYRERKPIRNLTTLWISDPDGVEVENTLNLYGFRGEPFEIQKTPNTTRVMLLGDSFVEGFGVGDADTIPQVLERAMGTAGVEVLNLGVGGIGLPEYARLASVAVPLLKPDVVVVVLYSNDFPARHRSDDYYRAPDFRARVSNPLQLRTLSLAKEVRSGVGPAPFYHRGPFPFFLPVPHLSNPFTHLPPHETIAHRLTEAMLAGRLNPMIPKATSTLEERLLAPLDRASAGYRYLAWLKHVVDRNGASLIAAYIPAHVTIGDHYREMWSEFGTAFVHESFTGPPFRQHQRDLTRIFTELEIPFVDTTSAIRDAEGRGRRLYHGYDSHMNPTGYSLVAGELHKAVETSLASRRRDSP